MKILLSRFFSPKAAFASGILGLFWSLSPTVCRADGGKPPASGDLYSYDGTLNISDVKADEGVSTSLTELNGAKMLKIDFAGSKGYPGLSFPVPEGGWNLSGYTGVQIDLTNPGTVPVDINLRVDNDGDWKLSPWSTDIIPVAPGETKALRVIFGQSFKTPGFKLDTAHITEIRLKPMLRAQCHTLGGMVTVSPSAISDIPPPLSV